LRSWRRRPDSNVTSERIVTLGDRVGIGTARFAQYGLFLGDRGVVGINLSATLDIMSVKRRSFTEGEMKLTIACTLTSLMLLCTPVLACETQIDPLPCEPAGPGLRQTDGQFIFAPRFRPVPSPGARARSNRRGYRW
jgi:hypothetical protein